MRTATVPCIRSREVFGIGLLPHNVRGEDIQRDSRCKAPSRDEGRRTGRVPEKVRERRGLEPGGAQISTLAIDEPESRQSEDRVRLARPNESILALLRRLWVDPRWERAELPRTTPGSGLKRVSREPGSETGGDPRGRVPLRVGACQERRSETSGCRRAESREFCVFVGDLAFGSPSNPIRPKFGLLLGDSSISSSSGSIKTWTRFPSNGGTVL